MVPWAHPNPQPKRHLDRCGHFWRAHQCDRPTDHATRSVTIGRIYVRSTAMPPKYSTSLYPLWYVQHVDLCGKILPRQPEANNPAILIRTPQCTHHTFVSTATSRSRSGMPCNSIAVNVGLTHKQSFSARDSRYVTSLERIDGIFRFMVNPRSPKQHTPNS